MLLAQAGPSQQPATGFVLLNVLCIQAILAGSEWWCSF